MRVVVAGGSGFLGSPLVAHLRDRGHTVTVLTRRASGGEQESTWDPYGGRLDQGVIGQADVVVNVAGSGLLGNPHSEKWKRSIRDSRIVTTRVLAEAIARADEPPAFLAGNGSSWYGDHGADPVTEDSDSRGDAFMTQVTRDWQAAADPALEAGARVCVLRTAPVMSRGGETMKLLEPLFKLGLGARLGRGEQFFPVISRRDWVAAVAMLAEHPTASGPINLCSPVTPTNAEFTATFARSVHRPAFLAAPRRVLSVGAGPAAPELLRSLDLRPAALLSLGYRFEDPDVSAVLASGLA
ncbi:TIGR01777 family oxidoreductase [Nocardioides euryhalodurans]|uniref:TIGR01777 family protein n=1 Tax=Nocardioides euryhalodurans TaxID=2518370 RepID=A0A4P7GIF5_9ACTN|nr:TIGR01777 family oxidoreductase [Nocardioides euryhalodurans]QBR91469.1 TIGR01777 family protein [Nocardioides euryhalodurans]